MGHNLFCKVSIRPSTFLTTLDLWAPFRTSNACAPGFRSGLPGDFWIEQMFDEEIIRLPRVATERIVVQSGALW
jgi:hypothetical protein